MSASVSIIIPVYNVSAFIGEALDSALRQNPLFKDIIIIDDGSTDGTGDVIARYKDSRIIYHRQNNKGLGPARNVGIELANTEFVYFMDGDDVLEGNLISSFYSALTNNSALDLYAFSAVDFENSSGRLLGSSDYMQRKWSGYFNCGRDAIIDSLKRKAFPACAYLYIFRRSAVEGDRHLRFMNILHEDEVFTPALFMNCRKTIVSAERYYRRRIRHGSIMTAPASTKNVTGTLQAMLWWMSQASSAPPAEAKLFRLQAHRFYNQAVRYASRANIGMDATRDIVRDYAPAFSKFVPFDYMLSRLSKRIAFDVGNLRARLVSWP
jgi:glycosyltransferase involved in cell wall biosynthesis